MTMQVAIRVFVLVRMVFALAWQMAGAWLLALVGLCAIAVATLLLDYLLLVIYHNLKLWTIQQRRSRKHVQPAPPAPKSPSRARRRAPGALRAGPCQQSEDFIKAMENARLARQEENDKKYVAYRQQQSKRSAPA